MTVYSVYIINKAGGLIYQYDHYKPTIEMEKTYSYPLEMVLEEQSDGVVVIFGQRDGVRVGHVIFSINGTPVNGKKMADKTDIMTYVSNPENYPLNIKFGRPRLSSNQKIMLASMFHSLYAISVQLSPEPGSSGIQKLESDVFALYCHQTLTGVKFVVIADKKQKNVDALLHKLHSIYSDFALKNPFYSLEMPIRAELFDTNIVQAMEQLSKTGNVF